MKPEQKPIIPVPTRTLNRNEYINYLTKEKKFSEIKARKQAGLAFDNREDNGDYKPLPGVTGITGPEDF